MGTTPDTATTPVPEVAPAVTAAIPASASSSYPPGWEERVGAFATAVKKSVVDVSKALESVVGEPSTEALAALADAEAATDSDLKDALKDLKIPSALFRTNLQKLRGAPAPKAAATADASVGYLTNLLPVVPDEESFIKNLRVGGVLKPGVTEVLSAVKAAIADKLGLYDLPQVILDKMETYAEEQHEPVGESFFKLQTLITSRSFADVLSAIGATSRTVTPRRQKEFLVRVHGLLWPSLKNFNDQLAGWMNSWGGSVNQGAAMTMFLLAQSGRGNALPPMAPPETATIRDAAESVIEDINKVFAGLGIPVARALAYEATRINAVLEEPTLPAAVGATNHEQMLKLLGVGVGPDYRRIEQNVTRFTLAIMKLPEVAADAEISYLPAMFQLGSTIPWDKLNELGLITSTAGRSGIGKSNNGRSTLRENY